MTEPLLTVSDLSVELTDNAGETELLRNYEFNISQGIVQRVSRFFDALALMDEAPRAARDESGEYADSARGSVMGFGHKRSVGNQEKSAHTVIYEATEQHKKAVAEAAEQAAKVIALEAKVIALEAQPRGWFRPRLV